MNQKDNSLTCDFVCEWFDFLRNWINNESDDHDADDCQGFVDCKINGVESDVSDFDDDRDVENCVTGANGHVEHQKLGTTNVTCFNCDDNFLFFGTNTGWIYCFSRGERQAKGPLYEHHPVKCRIIGIEIPDENVLLLLLSHGFIMFNFVRNEIIYSWSMQSDGSNLPSMVTSKCIYDNTRRRYHVFTGDSVGTIRCHNVIEDETDTIFNENRPDQEGDNNHHHTVVQIDIYSADLLLVSSCFRSLILWKSISDSWSSIQIGSNVRKVCGQYGAIFHRDGNTVIASRPAMHLIKANITDGGVVQTFKLKNVIPLKTLNLFQKPVTLEENNFLSKPTPTPTVSSASATLSLNSATNVFNFGYLMPLQINDEDYICSWNSHSLFIIKIDGTLLVKEYSSVRIIGANVSQTKGYRDVIILREDRTIFRIRFLVKREYVKSKTNDYGIGDVLKDTLGIQNLSALPTQALNSLEGEIKKIYTLMSDKIYERGEKLLNYTSFEQLNVLRRNNSMRNQFHHSERDEFFGNINSETSLNDQDYGDSDCDRNFYQPMSPLFIHQKVSRKNSYNLKFEVDSDKNEENILFAVDSHVRLSLNSETVVTEGCRSINDGDEHRDNNFDNFVDSDSQAETLDSPIINNNDDDGTSKESQQSRKSVCSETFNLNGLELTKKFNQLGASYYASEIKTNMLREGDNIFNSRAIQGTNDEYETQQLVNYVDSGPKIFNNLTNSSTKSLHNSTEEIVSKSNPIQVDCLPIRESRPIKYVDWQLAIENTHNSGQLEIKRFCASGYSDTETSTYVWLSCISKGRSKLVYYPDFESLRLPPGNNKSFTAGAIRNRIYLLNEDNELWFREGVDEPGLAIGPVLGTLATRWTKINKPKSINFVNFSLCSSDQLGWFCDTNGDVWLTKLRTRYWVKISHDPDNRFHVRNVQVCPTDSSLVWCIDNKNQLFVRAGIFNTRGDGDEHISGMAWLPVHTPVEVTSIAITNNSVWILNNQSYRIFKRIGIQPPSSYVGTDWQEIRSPTLIKDSLKDISASLNGDIWLLTEQGSIWQVCDP